MSPSQVHELGSTVRRHSSANCGGATMGLGRSVRGSQQVCARPGQPTPLCHGPQPPMTLSVPQTSQAGSHSRTSDFLCPFRVGHSLTTEKPWPAYLHPPHTFKTLAHVPQFYFLIAAYKYLVHCPPHPTGRELLQNQGASVLLRLHPAPAACLVSSALSKHVT